MLIKIINKTSSKIIHHLSDHVPPQSELHRFVVAVRYLLHLLHVLTLCDALNEINGVLNSIIVFSIVFADEK